MRLVHLMTNKVIIARKATISGDKMAYTTVTSQIMHVQPVADSSTEIQEGIFGKSFRIWMDGATDIQQGDRLRDDKTGHNYTVMPDGISRRTMGSLDYIIAVVQKTKR